MVALLSSTIQFHDLIGLIITNIINILWTLTGKKQRQIKLQRL